MGEGRSLPAEKCLIIQSFYCPQFDDTESKRKTAIIAWAYKKLKFKKFFLGGGGAWPPGQPPFQKGVDPPLRRWVNINATLRNRFMLAGYFSWGLQTP